MSISRSHKRRRILLIVDIVALLVAYIVMITLRFNWYFKKEWMIPLYRMIFVMELLFAALLNVYRGRKPGYKNVEELDPFEVFKETFINHVILIAFLLIVLMLTQNTYYFSRLAMGYLVILNMGFLYTFRMFYRAFLIKRGNPDIHRRRIAALCYEEDLATVKGHLSEELSKEFELDGVWKLDEAYPRDVVRTDKNSEVSEKRDALVNMIKNNGCSDAFVCIPDAPVNDTAAFVRNDVMKRLCRAGVNVYIGLSMDGIWITRHLIRDVGFYQASYFSAMAKKCRVLGVNFAVSNVENAVLYVKSHLKELRGKYICFCNVHTTVEASEHPDYMKIQNASALTFPDGHPIVGCLQKAGFIKAERIAGPDFMEYMFKTTMDGKVSHFFYGSSEETIELLKKKLPERFPGINIKGFYSPPFRELTEQEDEDVIHMLNSSGADLIWIGLGAPKQEKWMSEHEDKLSGVMLGVGAGFNFFAGNIKRAPVWIQKIGMEWLFRLFQDPKRLFRRYFQSNIKFIWKVFIQHK